MFRVDFLQEEGLKPAPAPTIKQYQGRGERERAPGRKEQLEHVSPSRGAWG